MTPARRRLLCIFGGLALGALLVWGATGLPGPDDPLGDYAQRLNERAVAQRHATNVVTAVAFDYRALDTMGEEFILFASALGAGLLLRHQRGERDGPPDDDRPGRDVPEPSVAVRHAGAVLVALAFTYGAHVVTHAHVTPGGGFQGGVVLTSALLLVYLTDEFETLEGLASVESVEALEGVTAAAFALVGVAGVITAGWLLANVLPLGTAGMLASAGTVPVLNLIVGAEVAAGLLFIAAEFLEQLLRVRAS